MSSSGVTIVSQPGPMPVSRQSWRHERHMRARGPIFASRPPQVQTSSGTRPPALAASRVHGDLRGHHDRRLDEAPAGAAERAVVKKPVPAVTEFEFQIEPRS